MHQGSRADQRVAIGPGIRNVESGTPPNHFKIDGHDAPLKGGQHTIVHPVSQMTSLSGISPFKQQNSDFQFEDRDYRQVHLACGYSLLPSRDASVDLSCLCLAKFGNDIRIQQINHLNSAGRGGDVSMRGGSNSISAASGMASKSAIRSFWPRMRRYSSTLSST